MSTSPLLVSFINTTTRKKPAANPITDCDYMLNSLNSSIHGNIINRNYKQLEAYKQREIDKRKVRMLPVRGSTVILDVEELSCSMCGIAKSR